MTTSTVPVEIVRFAQAVREALADLSADEVDDLTEGLEADLAESYAEDLARELPDPAEYAAELRTAAGMPKQRVEKPSGVLVGLRGSWRRAKADVSATLRDNAALSSVADFLVALRPAWWVARGWVGYYLASLVLGLDDRLVPDHADGWLILVATVLVSVQWGRGRWVPWAWVVVVANVVAALAILPSAVAAGQVEHTYYEDPTYYGADQGITLNGEQVSNVFAYGADGQLLTNVQLFDQTGRPLVPQHDPELGTTSCVDATVDCENTFFQRAAALETGGTVWNVFPLALMPSIYDEQSGIDVPDEAAAPVQAKAPFLKVPAVQAPAADPAVPPAQTGP